MSRAPGRLAVVLLAAAAFSWPRVGPAQDAAKAETAFEEKPYAIRAWLAVDPEARMGAGSARALAEEWRVLVDRFVGLPWQVELVEGDGPLRGRSPAELTEAMAAPAVEGADKGWFLRVEPAASGGGFSLAGREYDATTRQLGPLYRQPAPFPRDAARSLFELSRRVFAPLAEIQRTDAGAALIVQGAALPAADPVGRVAGPSSVFRPYYLFFQGADDAIREIRSIPFTYLRVETMDGPRATCALVSGLRQPLPRRVAGRYRLVALGLKPADVPTRFRFVAGEGEKRHPAAGYVLTARGVGDPVASEVGTTDREGRVALPPHFSDSLVVLRLMAGGVEPLREFPVLPGETPEEREVPVEPRPEAVALEFRLKALQDEIVDLIARRGVLEARLDARSEGGAWDEVKQLLDEYRRLPAPRDFQDRIARLAEDAQRSQAELKIPILTRTAQAELAETRALVDRYLTDEAYDAYLDAYQRSQDQAADADTPAVVAGPASRPAAPPANPAPAPGQGPVAARTPDPTPAPAPSPVAGAVASPDAPPTTAPAPSPAAPPAAADRPKAKEQTKPAPGGNLVPF